MYHPEYKKALLLLRKIHEHYRQTIKTNKQDVRLAIYYLAGGCITQANLAIQAWGNGDLNTPMRVKRFIDEAKLLIIYMIVINDRDRFVRRFFQDEIITINPKKYEREITKILGMDKQTFDKWLKNIKKLSHGFSKGVHPTYRSVAYNTNIDTGKFDYDLKHFAYYPIEGFDFAHFVIIPAIDSVILPSEVFGVSNAQLTEINKLRKDMQAIAIGKHQAKKSKKETAKG